MSRDEDIYGGEESAITFVLEVERNEDAATDRLRSLSLQVCFPTCVCPAEDHVNRPRLPVLPYE